jgi:hypothetical protein
VEENLVPNVVRVSPESNLLAMRDKAKLNPQWCSKITGVVLDSGFFVQTVALDPS